MKGRAVYFSADELEVLDWIVPTYKETHEAGWKAGILPEEEKPINQIIIKIEKGLNEVLQNTRAETTTKTASSNKSSRGVT